MVFLSWNNFKRSIRSRELHPIDGDKRFYNLAQGYWVYDELLSGLKSSGWFRFAPGFKAGLYGNPRSSHCIKILGMGVGENPQYFCERGYYLEHEEKILRNFRQCGFEFAPEPLSPESSIRLLVDECKLSSVQAEMRVRRHDLLVMELISGVPLATQTGRSLNYEVNIVQYEKDVVDQMVAALYKLKADLAKANNRLLLHNDPMPPNILFTLDDHNNLVARLVDFELSQDLHTPSPDWVNSSVSELYDERDVPRNTYTGRHTKNLDQHLMDSTIDAAEFIQKATPKIRAVGDLLDGIDVEIPFVGGISLNLGQAYRLLRGKG